MTLAPEEAERLMRARLGVPAKQETKYIIGFQPRKGREMAFDREALETRLRFRPPAPPALNGVHLLDFSATGNSNLNGPLTVLKEPDTLRVEIDSAAALKRFLDWYLDDTGSTTSPRTVPAPSDFASSFAHFQKLVTESWGAPFTRFDEGRSAVWEGYKPRLRTYALKLLAPESWTEAEIGTGVIVKRTIAAIEIQGTGDMVNNLVFWQNRFGHANRDHRLLLDCATEPKLCRTVERLLFTLYRGDRTEEGTVFEGLRGLSGGNTRS